MIPSMRRRRHRLSPTSSSVLTAPIIIWGLGGADHIFGENGNDVLIGGAGADVLDGGAGIDYREL